MNVIVQWHAQYNEKHLKLIIKCLRLGTNDGDSCGKSEQIYDKRRCK